MKWCLTVVYLIAIPLPQLDSDSDVIGEGGGMEKLFADLGVDAEDIITLILAWQMKAQKLGEFTRQEWTEGLTYLK